MKLQILLSHTSDVDYWTGVGVRAKNFNFKNEIFYFLIQALLVPSLYPKKETNPMIQNKVAAKQV